MTLDAPAKVNLSLRITGRRADGYHDLETFMVPLALADRLRIDLSAEPGVRFQCSDQTLPVDGANLAVRAAQSFFEATGWSSGISMTLEKHIPHGAGLGGGSSDAAAVLVGLNILSGLGLGMADLENMAAGIGSDVPFFVRCVPAICRGRGERIEPVARPPEGEILLVKPPFPVPTAWAYAEWARDRYSSATTGQNPCWNECVNDLELPVFAKFLVLPALRDWLREQPGVRCSMLSGSGSTVFALLEGDRSQDWERRVAEAFGPTFWTCQTRLAAGRSDCGN